ncbi:hypothetical protein [Kribbella sp. NPDC048915]|uniref:hypothetical protein n=1 Tax=Kribbella sp. NPDC048915 TaxID=3155148 RepID=UPI0033F13E18
MDAVAERHTAQAALARESADLLTELWKTAMGKQDHLEVLPTYEAAQSVLNSVQGDANEHVRAMTMGNIAAKELRIVEGLFDALHRGVRYDVIYGAHVLQDASALHLVQQCIDAGEQARVFPHVPLNITSSTTGGRWWGRGRMYAADLSSSHWWCTTHRCSAGWSASSRRCGGSPYRSPAVPS